MIRRLTGLALVLTCLSAALGCGSDDGVRETAIVGDTLTVFSSLPLRGPLAPVAADVARAEKLALQEAGGHAGAYDVGYVSLNSADPETGAPDPDRIAANARRAVQTANSIAYLGELEPGTSTISVPILDEGGILQVSPRDTYSGLTEPGPEGEPDRFYPSGLRNFTRVVPPGGGQAAALVAQMRRDGVRRLAVADDGAIAGTRLADRAARLARRAGIAVAARERLAPGRAAPARLAGAVRAGRADAVVYAGGYTASTIAALRAAHAAAPKARLYGTDELTLAPALAGRLGAAGGRLELTGVEALDTAGFDRRFAAAYGHRPDRQAIFGYRAMRVALDAIRVAGKAASSRRAVVRQAVTGAGAVGARFVRYRIEGGRVVSVGPPL